MKKVQIETGEVPQKVHKTSLVPCAGYLGHPFRKIGDLCQKIENGQVSSMNRQVDTWATRQKDDVFFLSWKESRRGRTITRTTVDTASHSVKSLSLTFGV